MRQHSIKTTYLIHKTLVENSDVMALVVDENKISLLMGDPDLNSTYPVINIRRDSISTEVGNKDFIPDRVQFSIKVYSDKYEESVDIADAIRFALENQILQDELVRLTNIKLISATEAWVSDAYEQSIAFSAEVTKPIGN